MNFSKYITLCLYRLPIISILPYIKITRLVIFNTINYKILLEISGLQKDGEPAAFLQFRISAQEKFSDLNSIKV